MIKEVMGERDIAAEFEGSDSKELWLGYNNAFVVDSQFVLQLHFYHPKSKHSNEHKLGIFAPWEVVIERLNTKNKGKNLSPKNPKAITFVSLTISEKNKYTLVGDNLITFIEHRARYTEIKLSSHNILIVEEIGHHLDEVNKAEVYSLLGMGSEDDNLSVTLQDIEDRQRFEVERALEHRSLRKATQVEIEFLKRKGHI